jgi:hypothetical protein
MSDKIVSPDKQYELNITNSGQLIVYSKSGRVIWASNSDPNPEPIIPDPPLSQTLRKLSIVGSNFYAGETRFFPIGISSFSSIQLYTGEKDIKGLFQFYKDNKINWIRVFMMLSWMKMYREDTVPALSPFLSLAEPYGIYVEIVALADTELLPKFDQREHCNEVSSICEQHNNSVLEIFNEPFHGVAQKADPEWLHEQALLTPISLICSEGSSNDFEDTSSKGDYITCHADRTDGDNGWRHVRHVKEMLDLKNIVNKPCISDEPIGSGEEFEAGRRENDPSKWRAKGLLTTLFGPETFHYQQGLYSQIPTGNQLECFKAWIQGVNFFPNSFKYDYAFVNSGWNNSPVKSFSNALRVYSGICDNKAFSIILDDKNAQIEWQNGFYKVDEYKFPGTRIVYSER